MKARMDLGKTTTV